MDKFVCDAQLRFGPNCCEVPVPPFAVLLQQQLVSPFFCFQAACVCLWLLDGYWGFPLTTLFLLTLVEAQVCCCCCCLFCCC